MEEWWNYGEQKSWKNTITVLLWKWPKNPPMCPCDEPTASRGNALKPQIDSRGDGSDELDSLRLRQSQHFSIWRPELSDLYNKTGTRLLPQSSLLLESMFPLLCLSRLLLLWIQYECCVGILLCCGVEDGVCLWPSLLSSFLIVCCMCIWTPPPLCLFFWT